MPKISYRQQYDYAADAKEREATAVECLEDVITVQDVPDSNLNELMARFGVKDGSELPASFGVTDPRYYGDFTEAPRDLAEAFDITRRAEDRFNQLPADLRAQFQNSPYQLYSWVSDPQNAEEAVTLGLLAKRPPKAVQAPAAPTTPVQSGV